MIGSRWDWWEGAIADVHQADMLDTVKSKKKKVNREV